MREKLSSKVRPNNVVDEAGKSSAKPLDWFLTKPAAVILLFGLTVWIFLPALQTDFQFFDENGELLLNRHMNSGFGWQNLCWALFSLEYSNWYPLTWISHMLDFQMYGKSPWGHHLTNVLLHAANSVLLFLLLKRMTGTLWRSLIVALLFAVHPMRVESVAWISERKDVLSAFFGLLALLFYVRYAQERIENRKSRIRDYSLALLFFACGLMSKSMLVTLPFLLLLLDFWPLNRIRDSAFGIRDWSRLLLEKAPFFLLVVPVCILVYAAQKGGGQFLLHFPLGFRLETALMGYVRYLEKMFWPVNLSVLYPYPKFWPVGGLLLAGLLISGMSVIAFNCRQRRPYLLVGWLWYLGTLVPVIGLIPLGAQSMSNRYTYIPMIGILVLAIWVIGDWSKRWRARNILATAVVVLTTVVSVTRTREELIYWKNSFTLWSRAVAITQNNFMAHYCLGIALSKVLPDAALVEYQQSVDYYPDYADAQQALGVSLMDHHRYSEAASHLEKVIELNPKDGWAYNNLGSVFFYTGRIIDSVPLFMKAIELDPQNPAPKKGLIDTLFFSTQREGSMSNFLATARSDPACFGKFFDAMEFDTNHVVILNNLAAAFVTTADPELRNGKYAIRLAERACEMTGYRTNYMVGTLAVAYAEDSRFDEAVSNAQLACSLTAIVGPTNELKGYQAMLELFRAHRPYHGHF